MASLGPRIGQTWVAVVGVDLVTLYMVHVDRSVTTCCGCVHARMAESLALGLVSLLDIWSVRIMVCVIPGVSFGEREISG